MNPESSYADAESLLPQSKDVSTSRAASLRAQMEKTYSVDILEDGKDLKLAAEQSLNVILDLTLDGHIRWVSPSWADVVGTEADTVIGKPIADIVLDDEDIFKDAVESLRENDSGSKVVRFKVQLGPKSRLQNEQQPTELSNDGPESAESGQVDVLDLEAQGIMVFDRATSEESHIMWMIRPAVQKEVTIDLPAVLVESLGVGAEMLAHHLTLLADAGVNDPENTPAALPVLCRICERHITPWWFPKHSELCLQEHSAEAEVQRAHEDLTEHRASIVKILDALEAQTRQKHLLPQEASSPVSAAEYKGMPISPGSPASSSPSSGSASRSSSISGRERQRNHARTKSFTVRRPLARIVELVLDLCDTAIEINTPALKESRPGGTGEFRTQSPQSEARIAQVMQWQSPSAGSLENEPGLAALCDDTTELSKAKVDAAQRYSHILEYSERIRSEFTALVQDCIEAALQKASRIAAGESSSDSSGDESTSKGQNTDENDDEQTDLPTPTDPPPLNFPEQPSAMAAALREVKRSRSSSRGSQSRASENLPDRSVSPRAVFTSSSRNSGVLSSQGDHRSWFAADIEPGVESDTSRRSSIVSEARRAESPASETTLSRTISTRERKRTSLVLPRAVSLSRSHSPARAPPPQAPGSPVKTMKPRVVSGSINTNASTTDGVRSPLMSPVMSGNEFCSPPLPTQQRHHRRQSSAASSEISRAALSPHLSMTSGLHPRANAPSIKDFEIIKPISKGAFGSVYLAKKKSTGDYYAIKALKKADMVAKNQVANVKAERAILMWQGESDFVAKLYWTFPSKDFIFLVMEYLNGGDCASLVRALGTLPEDWAKRYLAEVVLGVEHLHERGIVHRDLKPDNLLIDQKGHLKLTDFGLSRMGLIGRQKRALNVKDDHLAPDPLKQGPFARSSSMASSRSTSASFDIHAAPSPGSTPNLTPVYGTETGIPSYFNLSREGSGSRDQTRHGSSHHSEPGEDHLQAAFRRLSVFDELFNNSRHSPKSEEPSQFESPETEGLSQPSNNAPSRLSMPPPSASMPPPAMALFDPDDTNRRFVGTPDYLAPETINGLGQDEMSDWWSIGCILFEFVFGYPPFHADTPDQVFQNILDRKIDWPSEDVTDVSADTRDLINRMIALDPRDRLGSNKDEKFKNGGEEIRNHPWFADVDWETINESEASFVPAPANPEDTDYFDPRGATHQDFTTEFENQDSSPAVSSGNEYPDRPYDALSRVRNQVNSINRKLMPLHIPKHVRDGGRTRRLSEPVGADDFGQFSFKNLPVLEKANKDVIQKLRAEAMHAQNRQPGQSSKASTPSSANPSGPSLENSPSLVIPPKRAPSGGTNRSASPSTHSYQNSSPSRGSQPTSPLVQFSAGHHERRKTSSGSSQSATGTQHQSFFDVPRLTSSLSQPAALVSGSPIRQPRSPGPSLENDIASPHPLVQVPLLGSPRTRSKTVGSRDTDARSERPKSFHQKHKSQVLEVSPNSSDTDEAKQKAMLKVQRRRQSSRRHSVIKLQDEPFFRPLDVLVCEDHPVSRLVMEKLLEKLRCRIIVVENGAEAIRYALSSVRFDIVLMEYKLPQINGTDVARMMRETKNANQHTPIVAVTGYLKELQAPHHFNSLIEKPATVEKLTSVLSQLCHWAPCPPGWTPNAYAMSHPGPVPQSRLRNESMTTDESPVSTSSGFQPPSRADSMSSGTMPSEPEPRRDSGASITVTSPNSEEFSRRKAASSLGISYELPKPGHRDVSHVFAAMKREDSEPAPGSEESMSHESRDLSHAFARMKLEGKVADTAVGSPLRKQSSGDMRAAKRSSSSRDRSAGGELGDDEDEELGTHRSRSRSPRSDAMQAQLPGSGLSVEMLRTDSQQSVVSVVQSSQEPRESATPPIDQGSKGNEDIPIITTPPEYFAPRPGDGSKDFDMDATPTPANMLSAAAPPDQETPRPPRLGLSDENKIDQSWFAA